MLCGCEDFSKMAESKSKLPVFNLKEKSYETYRFELDCWLEVTPIVKKRRGIEVLLSLPESSKDDRKTREHLVSKMTKDELTAEDGIEKLLQYMDAHLKLDDLGSVWEKFIKFDDVRRGSHNVNEYMASFDIAYNSLRKENVELPSSILALMLIRKASLTSEEIKLTLTGLDYARKDTLYTQAISALRKFAGDQAGLRFSSKSAEGEGGLFSAQPLPTIKQEVNMVDELEEEVYRAFGSNAPPWRRGYGRGRGWSGNNRGYRGRQHDGKQEGGSQGGGEKVNPKNRYGDYLRCHGCGSFRHLIGECPDAKPRGSNQRESDGFKNSAVLYTGNIECYTSELAQEADNCVILDSACTATVCGKSWMEKYRSSLSEDKRKTVTITQSRDWFKFGGGEKLISQGKYVIPAVLAGKEVRISTDVVDSQIPLLLSLSAMKRAGVKLNTVNDTAEVLGENVNLSFTTSGHYCLSLNGEEDVQVLEVQEVLKVEFSPGEVTKKLMHLHKQFAHPCTDKLTELLKNANSWKSEYAKVLENIAKNCETCKRFKKGIRKPVVCIPLATRFNQVVTLDLKKWGSFWIIYMIDYHSRLVVARRISRKFPSEVVQAFMLGWLGSGYGIPEGILVDNGGEFTAEEIQEMTSVLNIKVNTTASNSPFSNGLCEKNHAIVDNMLEKLEYDNPKIPFNDLLSWACTMKNAMGMFAGYSPYQIVFGKNPVLPGFEVHPPALNEIKGDMLLRHLKAQSEAKKAFVEADTSEKIRRALRHKIRISERDYSPGDEVYYKKENCSQWLGPAKVIVQDGKIVFIRHGAYIIRIYTNRVVLRGEEYGTEGQDVDKPPEPVDSNFEEIGLRSVESVSESEEIDTHNSDSHMENTHNGNSERVEVSQSTEKELWKGVKVNDKLRFRSENSDPWITGTVVGRAGKASGKNVSWFNVETNDDRFSVDLRQMEVEIVPSVSVTENHDCEENDNNNVVFKSTGDKLDVLSYSAEHVILKVRMCPIEEQAKLEEVQKLKEFCTYDTVDDRGQDRISTKWVITDKGGGKKKARLVARGFEETDYIQSDSPTVTKSVIRIVLTLCATLGWIVKTTDIKSAYLQGQSLSREVYIKPPLGYEEPNKLWKLKKCLYGLNDGARNFYLSVKEYLLSVGCEMSNLEPAMFVYKVSGRIHGIIVSHVDDFLHGGTTLFEKDVMDPLMKKYTASRQSMGQFKYVGLNVKQGNDRISVNQQEYSDAWDISTFCTLARGQERDLNSEEYSLFRQLVGQINWLANGSRPDVCFPMIDLSTKFNKAHTSHLAAAIKVMKRLKGENVGNVFPKLSGLKELKVVVYTDASFGNLNGVDSCGGHIVFLSDRDDRSAPIAWHSGKVKRVVRSTLAAETVSLLAGIEEAIYLRELLTFCLGVKVPIMAIVDNRSLMQSIQSTHLVDEKRLRIDISAVKEFVECENVSVHWVPGQRQLADCLTKHGASPYELQGVISGGQLPHVD